MPRTTVLSAMSLAFEQKETLALRAKKEIRTGSNETRTFKKSNRGHILHTLKITNIPQALNGSLT
jgi:hypothetical protein